MQTETIQLTLPLHLVERLRERVRSGEFTDENAAVADALQQVSSTEYDRSLPRLPFDPANPSMSGTLEDWEQYVLPARLSSWESGNQETYSLSEMAQRMADLAKEMRTDAGL